MQGVTVNGYRRLAKPTAKRLYNSGATIYLVPCALRPGGAWNPEVAISKSDRSESASYFVSMNNDFEHLVNEFAYYNCRHSTGRYPAYYIKAK